MIVNCQPDFRALALVVLLCPPLTLAIQCYVGSNLTSTLQSSTRFSPFKSCQIITQKCPYPLPGNLCIKAQSFTEVLPIDTVKAYSGSGGDCVTVRKAYVNVDWPIFGLVCCDKNMCNAPFGKDDTVFNTTVPVTGNLHPQTFGPKIGAGPIESVKRVDDHVDKDKVEPRNETRKDEFRFDDTGNGSGIIGGCGVLLLCLLATLNVIC